MTISAPRNILVALEDSATAGVVATAAAHLAMDQNATTMILVHVIGTHMGAGGCWACPASYFPWLAPGRITRRCSRLPRQPSRQSMVRLIALRRRSDGECVLAAIIAQVAEGVQG